LNGKRAKRLRRELKKLLAREPAKAGEIVPRYPGQGSGLQRVEKSEWRTYKRADQTTVKTLITGGRSGGKSNAATAPSGSSGR